jgi:hypothetical protein
MHVCITYLQNVYDMYITHIQGANPLIPNELKRRFEVRLTLVHDNKKCVNKKCGISNETCVINI